MDYISLYRKWRPQVFEDIVGQSHITKILVNAIKQNRLVHAYLFSGPRGTGKTTTAKVLAKAINCEKGPTPVPCNECTICHEISQGISLDVVEIDAASNRGIDEVRELRDKIRLTPSSSRKKVYIIDEVHMLTVEASNALLKIVEEPPSHIVFILATTELHKVIPTIQSRCQCFEFRNISILDIKEYLQRIISKEKIKADDEAISMIAREARGSMRDAISTLDQLSSSVDKKISKEDVLFLLGITKTEFLLKTADSVVRKDISSAFNLVHELVENGVDLRQFSRDLMEYFRNILIAKTTENFEEILNIPPEEASMLKEQSAKFSLEEILNILDRLNKLITEMRASTDLRLPLELALTGLLSGGEISEIGISEGGHKIELEPGSGRAEPSSGRACSTLEEIESSPDLAKIERTWKIILDEVKKKKPFLYSILYKGLPCHLDNDFLGIKLPFANPFYQEQLALEENQNILKEIIKQKFDLDLEVKVFQEEKKEVPTLKEDGDREVEDKELKQEIDTKDEKDINKDENQAIKLVMDSFDAEIEKNEESKSE